MFGDAAAIFSRYAGDPRVTIYLSWPTHRAIEDTRAFLAWSDAQWRRWPAGPYLIESRETGELLGSTGLGFETPDAAITGYVLARDAWGFGYATEALRAMVALAHDIGVRRLYAHCHADHRASARVLEKCGFVAEALLEKYSEFPNFKPEQRQDTLRYALEP
jgi:RimJ/RimL family protein N-acetyltransferase